MPDAVLDWCASLIGVLTLQRFQVTPRSRKNNFLTNEHVFINLSARLSYDKLCSDFISMLALSIAVPCYVLLETG